MSLEDQLGRMQEEWRDEVRDSLNRLTDQGDSIRKDLSEVKQSMVQIERIADHESRIKALERFQWRTTGLVIGAVFFMELIFKAWK